jgi:hypothetical protein
MRAKSASRIVALVASATVALAGTAQAASVTNVTIKGPQGDFHGRVRSSDGDCVGDRTVKVFKLRRTDKIRIGTDTSDSDGRWSIGTSGYKNGRFYARAVRSPGCKADNSKTIKLIDGVQQ